MIMKNNKIVIFLLLLTSLGSCKKLENGLINPNGVDPSLANVDLLLNTVQLSFTGFYTGSSDFGGQLTRQQQWFGPLYNNGYSPESVDGLWIGAYQGVLINANTLLPLAINQKKFFQAGIAQVLKAYVLGTLVDNFGDVPNSEATLGEENLAPKADGGAEVYKNVITLLDSAISNFAKSGAAAGPTNDLFFSGSKSKWATTAKTLKLKFLMQTRLVDNTVGAKIQTLVTDGDFIDTESEDFTFRYSTVNNSPDSRHPHYASNYNNASAGNNSANDYIGNYFMWTVGFEKSGGNLSNLDPRRRYYFYRQRASTGEANSATCPCLFESRPAHYTPDMPFCILEGGYWGRDHGDASGTPPDNPLRTTWGVYPAGGEFDASQNNSVDNTRGGKGAGIDPIWVSSFTYFLQAEAALTLNISTSGDAKSLLKKGVEASIAKVLAFPASVNVVVPANRIPTQAIIDTYVNTVLGLYEAATTNAEKLNVIMKEYYIAAWGNGIEPYNNYRRTGYPDNLQPVKTTPNPGFFIRSFFYPSVYVNRNMNAPAQKIPGAAANKVFWDNNPDNFIK